MTKLKELEQKIVEMVPELWQEHEQIYRKVSKEGHSFSDRIILEDVLQLQGMFKLNFDGLLGVVDNEFWCILSFPKKSYGIGIYWQLGKPLSEQPEETINFLHGIIVK